MAGSVKNKIRWGTIFLFFLVVVTGAVSIYHLARLRMQSGNILKANYESLQYAHDLQKDLDSLDAGRVTYQEIFNRDLERQEKNITEPGEFEATRNLRSEFNKLSAGDSSAVQKIRYGIHTILSLNMEAIQRKYSASEKAADRAVTIIVASVALILLIGLTFAINFPSVITSPIKKLTEAIRQIGEKNYHHRIHMDSKDEFGELADAFNDMAERLEYFESSNLNKLIFEKARAEAVINSLKDASIGINKEDTVLFANDQALQLLGLTAKDMVGMNVYELGRRNDLLDFLMKETGTSPFKIVVDNRENYFIKEIIEVAQDSSGSRVIVLKNITSFKELDVAKTNFIATVSHELKTPLASSDFSLKLLEDERIGQLSPEQKELIQNLKSDNQRMLRILSELLNISQVETGKIQLHVQPVSPVQLVENSLQAVTTAAREKSISLTKDIEAGLPSVQADADKAIWVLNNFLVNAIRYSPSGSDVSIAVKKDRDLIVFIVTDHGPGIEEAYLDRIFDRYFQIPGRSDKKGSGIGLAICKELMEAMGGSVWVNSRVGSGSSFGFNLPVSFSKPPNQ